MASILRRELFPRSEVPRFSGADFFNKWSCRSQHIFSTDAALFVFLAWLLWIMAELQSCHKRINVRNASEFKAMIWPRSYIQEMCLSSFIDLVAAPHLNTGISFSVKPELKLLEESGSRCPCSQSKHINFTWKATVYLLSFKTNTQQQVFFPKYVEKGQISGFTHFYSLPVKRSPILPNWS